MRRPYGAVARSGSFTGIAMRRFVSSGFTHPASSTRPHPPGFIHPASPTRLHPPRPFGPPRPLAHISRSMSDFRLYNTMARAVVPFAPADGTTVRMYTCGPTVYKPAHLGNFRTFLFEDLLRRAIRLRGWKTDQVMNLTDVDDKIIAKAASLDTTIDAITAPVIARFHEDRRYLKIEDAEHYPRATEYIAQMIDLVARLLAKGLAYQADDRSVYFAIARFPSYGKLSQLDTREIKPGARVAQDDYSKENAQDFALWKAAKPEDERVGAAWDAPWGRGRPGWHLECSAMALSLLGETLDLHCGGVDLIFPHHEDEIAQSEGATGVQFARCWCHGAFLLTQGAKMAKRADNVLTVADLRDDHISAAAVRHLMFTTHYRHELNLAGESLAGSQQAVGHLRELADRLEAPTTVGGTAAMSAAADELEGRVREALFDDLSSPQALAAVHDFVRAANADLDRKGSDRTALDRAGSALDFIEATLGIVPARGLRGLVTSASVARSAAAASVAVGGGSQVATIDEVPPDAELREYVEERLQARQLARTRRDFATADAIRAELESKGIALADTGAGTSWKAK
jgi:cysteinyl-tRNA synthetase